MLKRLNQTAFFQNLAVLAIPFSIESVLVRERGAIAHLKAPMTGAPSSNRLAALNCDRHRALNLDQHACHGVRQNLQWERLQQHRRLGAWYCRHVQIVGKSC